MHWWRGRMIVWKYEAVCRDWIIVSHDRSMLRIESPLPKLSVQAAGSPESSFGWFQGQIRSWIGTLHAGLATAWSIAAKAPV